MGNTILRIVITSILGVAGLCSAFSQEKAVCEKDYVAYLFTYFTGNHISEEAVCYAVSMDGYSLALRGRKDFLYGRNRHGERKRMGLQPGDGDAEVYGLSELDALGHQHAETV